MMSKNVGVINLGCARNLVDAQMMLGRLKKEGHRLVGLDKAQTVIINTCSFIEEARQESIDTILDVLELKKQGKIQKVVVAGCLAQRYGKELAQELRGVDEFVGVPPFNRDDDPHQELLTPKHFAYVKICESCFNACSFCAIPKIKGKFVSRPIESVLSEVSRLDAQGIKEVNIIGQDITAYGMDIYRQKSLARLLQEMVKVCHHIEWIRLLYAFPAHVTDELLHVMAREPKICKYIDMPLQHISDHILKEQNRNITTQQTFDLIQKIRTLMPQGFLRTTFITGLPGETQEDFEQLRSFMKATRFEHVGVFVYSREEGTKAAMMPGQVPEKIKKARLNILMKQQQSIAAETHQGLIGKRLKVLIEEKDSSSGGDSYIGRSEYDAPDVDGVVYVRSKRPLKAGDFVEVAITDAYEYDLAGHAL